MKLSSIYEQLLTEKDNRRTIINKIGVDQEVANLAHEISDKFSIWIANQAKIENPQDPLGFITTYKTELEKIVAMFKTPNKPKMEGVYAVNKISVGTAMELVEVLVYVKDWTENPNTPSVDLTQYTWTGAERASREWHASLTAKGKITGLNDASEIIHKFPDGYYWSLTEDNYCEASAESMVHCAEATENDMYLLHLRKNDEEFVTADWHPTDKYIIQLKGKQNKNPVPKYHKYIVWLLADSGMVKKLRTDEGYMPETNLQMGDLSETEIEHIINKNPTLISVETRLKRSDNPVEFINEFMSDDANVGALGWTQLEKLVSLLKHRVKLDKNTIAQYINKVLNNDEFIQRELIEQRKITELRRLLHYIKTPNELIRKIVDSGKMPWMYSVTDYSAWVINSDNPAELIDILGDRGIELTKKNWSGMISRLKGRQVDELIDHLITKEWFISWIKDAPRSLNSTIQYSNDPEHVIVKLPNSKNIQNSLANKDAGEVEYMLSLSPNKSNLTDLFIKVGNPHARKIEPTMAGESVRLTLRKKLL